MFSTRKKQIKIQELAQVHLHGLKLDYQVTYSKRRSISIKIQQGRRVVVSAPLSIKKSGVEKFLHQKADWIIEKLQKQDSHIDITAPKNFVDGEQIYFLGHCYKLVIKKGLASEIILDGDCETTNLISPAASLRGSAEAIQKKPEKKDELLHNEYQLGCHVATAPRNDAASGNIIILNPTTKTSAQIKTQLKNWYKAQITQIFNERLDECLKLTAQIGIKYSSDIQPRKMHKRWGTCTHKNQIILSSNLIFLGLEFIDYVILHELCHFKQKNHSPKYYALLQSVCPNYKDIRKRLNQHNIENFL